MVLSEITMTDEVRRIISAFSDAPVMTLQAVTIMAGLSEYAPQFILFGRPGWLRKGMSAGV